MVQVTFGGAVGLAAAQAGAAQVHATNAATSANTAGVAAATAMAFVSGLLFASSAAGLAGTTNGQYFSVQDTEYSTVYQNDAGVADQQAQYYTKAGIDARFKVTTGASTKVAAVGYDAWASGAGEDNAILGFEAANTLTDPATSLGNAKGLVLIGAYAAADGNFASDFGTAVGYQALRTSDFAYCFTGVGLRVGYNINGDEGTGAGAYITAIGCDAGLGITTGKNMTFVGAKCGLNATSGTTPVGGGITGDSVTGCGNEALYSLTSGSYLAAFGAAALKNNTSATYNVAVGYTAGRDITTSSNNVLIGGNAGYRLTTGLSGTGSNIGIGKNALSAVDTGGTYENVAVGNEALAACTVARNSAVGTEALKAVSTGTALTAFGYRAGYQVTTGINMTLIGSGAGGALTNQNSVTAVGTEAMATATGSFCVAVGRQALYASTGAQNTAIGYQSNNGANAFNNTICIGYQAAVTASNQVSLGNSSVTQLLFAGTKILGVQGAAITSLTATASSGSLPTPNGSVTFADAATPTVVELLEAFVELKDKQDTILARLRASTGHGLIA